MSNLLHARCQAQGVHAMSDTEIRHHLSEVSGWQVNGGAIEKTFAGKQPVTYAALTGEGRDVLKAYWKRFDKVREGVRQLKPLRVNQP